MADITYIYWLLCTFEFMHNFPIKILNSNNVKTLFYCSCPDIKPKLWGMISHASNIEPPEVPKSPMARKESEGRERERYSYCNSLKIR